MKLIIFLKRHAIDISLSIIIIAFLLYNCLELKLKYEDFFTVLAIFLTITVTIYFEKVNKRKIQYDIAHTFNERYDKLNEKLYRIIEGLPFYEIHKNEDLIKKLNLKTLVEEIDFNKKLIIYDYLNLCAEEYYWFKKGVLNTNIWINWNRGISLLLERLIEDEYIRKIIYEEYENNKDKDSYYGFFKTELMEAILNDCNENN